MIIGDLDRLLAESSPGGTPTDGITSAGTWQPAPPGSAPWPGTYATPVAFRLAGGDPARATQIAMTFAAAVRQAGWVRSATVTGGYLTISVTAAALAALAVRITQAGPACARSTALAGTTIPAPRDPGLAAALDWAQARRRLSESISGRLAEVAGARILPSDDAERQSPPTAAPPPALSREPARPAVAVRGVTASALSHEPACTGIAAPAVPGAASGPVADAIAFAGSGAITYTLARIPPGAPARADPCLAAAHHAGNPAYAVRYAHANAASILRQAADLGLGLGEAAGFQPRLLAHPTEQWLLDELSWLPERVAGAARRARPDVLTRYLERLAGAYFDCQETCPAMGPGVRTGGPETVARLWLAAASGTALRAGLHLLGVDAPERL